MRKIQDLVAAVACDDSALRSLRLDPDALAQSVGLGPEHVAALWSAERFFASEGPILDRPAVTPFHAAAARPGLRAIRSPLASELTATADTGTLHTGPTSGTYTISSSASFPETSPPVPAPQPPPAPGTPSPVAPPSPATPPAPATPPGPAQPAPTAPVAPSAPGSPVYPAPGQLPTPGDAKPPGAPVAGPPESPVPAPVPVGPHVCCQAAIAAMVAEVGSTASTALVALTALARHRPTASARHARGAAP